MAAAKVGNVLAKGLGIDTKASQRQIPEELNEKASLLVSPHDTFFEDDVTVKEWLQETMPSRHDVLPYLASFFPFTKWITRYNTRWLFGDVIAGITLGLVVVPQALSYALLANLSPEYGLYTSFTGASLYWLFGTSKDIAIGATAVVSLLVGSTGTHVVEQHPEFTREQVAKTHAFVCGCILLLFGLLRLDWIIEFIPHVAIAAFVTGSAITISLSQLPALLGIEGVNSRGPAYEVFINVCKALPETQMDAAIGITALILLSFIKWFAEFMTKRNPRQAKLWSTISSLRLTFTILLYTFISFLVHRTVPFEESTFAILGPIPVGFSHAGPPTFDSKLLSALLPEIPATVIILIIEHIAIGKSFGRVNNYTVIPSQELVSIGATNLLGPFVGAYASTGSFGGTAILAKAGVRTPLAGVFNGVILLLALYVLTQVLYYIPMASLAALIIHAVINLITSPNHLFKTWLISPPDVFIYFVGVFVSVFTNLENGIYTTVAMSAVLLLLRLARAKGRFVGRVRYHQHPQSAKREDTSSSSSSLLTSTPTLRPEPLFRDTFIPLDRADASNPQIDVEAPKGGIFIYRFTEGFNYLNQAQYIDTLLARVMEETRRTTVTHYAHPGDRPWNDPAPAKTSKIFDDDHDPEMDKPTLKAIILDCSTVNNMDSGAIEGLIDMRAQLDRWASPDPVQWHFANLNNKWARRAVAVAGFGYPSNTHVARHGWNEWDPVYSMAEKGLRTHVFADAQGHHLPAVPEATAEKDNPSGPKIAVQQTAGVLQQIKPVSNLAPLYAINRPNFHADVSAALEAVMRGTAHAHDDSHALLSDSASLV